MARKYIQVESPMRQRKIFLDDLKKIHKRRVKATPAIPKFWPQNGPNTYGSFGDKELIFDSLSFELR
jgi:hypothetical protein